MSTRDRLLDAAQASFAQHGYGGTSIRDVAAAVGIKESSVYKHVASKQALLEAVLSRAEERMAAAAETLHVSFDEPAAGDYVGMPAARLREISEHLLDVWLHDPAVVGARRVLVVEQYRTARAAQLLDEWTLRRPLAFQEQIFAALIEAGAFRPAEPAAVALAFWGPMLAALGLAERDEPAGRELLVTHLRHFVATYPTPRPTS